MPKKTRRMKQRAAMRRMVAQTPGAIEEAEMVATPAETAIRMRPTVTSVRTGLQDYDYSHIYGDLKRIALFASFFFAVLIVLSFVIK